MNSLCSFHCLQSARAIAGLLRSSVIVHLNLENCRLGDTAVSIVVRALEAPLRTLNMNRCKIGLIGATTLGAAVARVHTLASADLSWNSIRGAGAAALFKGLESSKGLEVRWGEGGGGGGGGGGGSGRGRLFAIVASLVQLHCAHTHVHIHIHTWQQSVDLSWNAVGSCASGAAPAALASVLAHNNVLVHLDLSHNQLGEAACQTMARGLATNHTLMGLHMDGNRHVVDPRGFLSIAKPEDGDAAVQQSHTFTRIIGYAGHVCDAVHVEGRRGRGRCVDVWMCGCVDVWMCRCVDVSMCRCVDVSMCRCVDVWMCGCVVGVRCCWMRW